MWRAVWLVVVGVAGCADSHPQCADVEPRACGGTPGCQLVATRCDPQTCPDGNGFPELCQDTEQPTTSSGPSCSSLDASACHHRDDCSVVVTIHAAGRTEGCQ